MTYRDMVGSAGLIQTHTMCVTHTVNAILLDFLRGSDNECYDKESDSDSESESALAGLLKAGRDESHVALSPCGPRRTAPHVRGG